MPESRAQQADAPPGALAGLTVLEWGQWVAAPWCAKLLADLGARVIKVEPPEGDAARRYGPFPDDREDPEQSALFLYLNTGKESIPLDLAIAADRERFEALAARADVLIEDGAPGTLAALGLAPEQLCERHPGLVLVSITPFGQTGPDRAHRSHALNLYHAGGHSAPFAPVGGIGTRAPARAGGFLGEYDAGLTAAVGVLAALLGRARSGRGQHIDVSKQEAMMCLERVTIGRSANEPDPFSGRGPGGLIRARDGWVMLTTLEPHQWDGLVRAMGEPAWTREPWCRDAAARMEHRDRVEARLGEWAAERSREEIYHLAQSEGTPAAPVRDVAEVLAWPQARERGFFAELEHPRAGRLQMPTLPWRAPGLRWCGRRAPLLGEQTEAILAELERDPAPAPPPAPSAPGDPDAGPLAGLRITDFTWAWAGPQGSLLLAMLGAEVFKIESRARLDHSRVHSLTAGSLSGGIDESPVFNDLNLGKRSVTLDLRSEEARGLVRRLVGQCDVVLQNMRPGVLERLGLGYEELRAVRPDLVMLSSSAMGASGPEGRYAGYAPTFACGSGVASVSGHPDEPPSALSGSVDLRVGTMSAFAVLAALLQRQQTGEGQAIDLSSTEVMASMMGDFFVAQQLSGHIPRRLGNRDARMAPHGCYRCAGEGEWLSLAVADDAEWQALRRVLDDPELADPAFEEAAGRRASQDALDAAIERWSTRRSLDDAVETLQAAGVAAARLQTGASLARDPHVRARQVYQLVDHPKLGSMRVVRPPWRMRGARLGGPAPLLGQHVREVLGGVLGLDDETIDRLQADGVVH